MQAGDRPDPFDGIADRVPAGLREALRELTLVDHHVHGVHTVPVSRQTFESALNEASTDPAPRHPSMFDSPLGLAIRRWCAPVLGLPRHAPADDYWAAREALDPHDLARRLLAPAGVERWIVDTGHAGNEVSTPEGLASLGGGSAHEILRLESTLETIVAGETDPADVPDRFRAHLADAAPRIAGAKTICAYRCGFDIDWSRPADAEVVERLHSLAGKAKARIEDPVLVAFVVHAAIDAGLPLQVHVGYGDRDVDLRTADPLLLMPLLRDMARTPVTLLHCYPFQREAAYLAQAFDHVYFDVGLAVNYLGASSPTVLAEALELAPFGKQLYSSDAWGLPELHLLGSLLWRRGTGLALGEWIARGDCAEADAIRIARMIGRENAGDVYDLARD